MGGRALVRPKYEPHVSIAVVGLQGAGKRSLAFIAAFHLQRRLVLECAHFEQETGLSKAAYIRKHGRGSFYSKAIELLKLMLQSHGDGCVIVCGVVSLVPGATEVIAHFARNHPVIHIRRQSNQITLLNQSREAEQLHALCSNLEYYNLEESDADLNADVPELSPFYLRKVRADFEKFLDFAIPQPEERVCGQFDLDAIDVERRSHSTVATVDISDVLDGTYLTALENHVEDAVELQIARWDELADLGHCIATLRRATRKSILLSYKSSDELSLRASQTSYIPAMLTGVRLGVEYLVLDPNLAGEQESLILASRGRTKTIAHYHFDDDTKERWSSKQRMEVCIEAQKRGYDVIRLTQDSSRRQDNNDVSRFLQIVAHSGHITIPVSAYNIGPFSQASKILNTILTPVCSSLDARNACSAHGEHVSVQDSVQARFASFKYDALSFHVLGTHVSESLTPTMNQAAYEFYGLRHSFTRSFTPTFDEVSKLVQNAFFGGGAITTPLKERAYQACIASSPHAVAIGAVNTVLPLRRLVDDKSQDLAEQARQRNQAGPVIGLYGDNSDWFGIYTNIQRRLSPRNAANVSRSTALIIGAGGSARSAVYALMRLKLHTIFIFNRTRQHSIRLKEHFQTWGGENGYHTKLLILDDLRWPGELQSPNVIVSCVPSGAMGLPEGLLQNCGGGVVADMCYAPPNARLHSQVRRLRSREQYKWSLVEGVDILLESCILQFEQMTGMHAPRSVMERALRAASFVQTT